MNKKLTNIIAHFTIIGLIISFFSPKRNECKFYLNQNIVLNILAGVIALIRLIPSPFINYIQGGLSALLAITWLYSLLGAIWEVKHHIPGISKIKIL